MIAAKSDKLLPEELRNSAVRNVVIIHVAACDHFVQCRHSKGQDAVLYMVLYIYDAVLYMVMFWPKSRIMSPFQSKATT